MVNVFLVFLNVSHVKIQRAASLVLIQTPVLIQIVKQIALVENINRLLDVNSALQVAKIVFQEALRLVHLAPLDLSFITINVFQPVLKDIII